MNLIKKFQIFKSDAKPEVVEAEKVEWIRKSDGLLLKFLIGKKIKIKKSGVICLIEIAPEIIPSTIPKNEEQDDD